MTETVIQIENLGKKYLIRHQSKERYTAIRDVVAQKTAGIVKRILHPKDERESNSSCEEFWALKNVSLEVKRGEVVGIIGPNGAGKSTLLKILSRITDPTQGRVRIRGRVASLLEVGTGFHPELTGRENIYLNGAILGMSKAEIKSKFDEIVAFAEVEKFLDTPVKRYSSGMYVRLAFSVAAHLEPEILLIDEVLAVGDAAFQKKCLGKMDDVSRTGRTVLFVSHSFPMIQKLCSRAVLLENGMISTRGSVHDVISYYLKGLSGEKKWQNQNLFHIPRTKAFGQKVRISDCKIFNASHEENDHLRFGEPFCVELECVALMKIRDLSFVLGIDSIVGIRIITSMSEENGCTVCLSKNEKIRARLVVKDLILKPGQYFLTVGVRQNRIGLDQIINAKTFYITSFLNDESVVPMKVWGIVHLKPEWSLIER
ncbi:MAG: ABC transporter ATP-binding protein [Deltaproteobacteria bacterium]|nr:ABC transporter ATP-binding protein [Deltaproteobacteria bacterium]